MYYVYLISSINFPDKKYVGCTDNFEERLATHNSGGSVYTKAHRPWKIKVLLQFETREEASRFEKYLKSGSGRAFAQKRFWC
jgi:predicted GIY-YIG superfamily endonuclease